METIKLGVRDKDKDCASVARDKVYSFELDNIVEIRGAKEVEAPKLKRLAESFGKWWQKNELLWGGAGVFIIAVAVVSTEEGNRMLEKLLDFFSTPFGAIIYWPSLIIVVLFGFLYILALAQQYRWFHHLFVLCLIGWLYFIAEDSKQAAGIVAIMYVGSIILPKWWAELSDELVVKIIARLELLKNRNSS